MMYRHFDSTHTKSEVLVKTNFGWLNDCANENNTEEDIYFYHKDHLGSSTQITDREATVIHHIEYMPSGELFAEQRSTWGTNYKFNSKELDQETGLYYYGARYYNPTLSIWASVDPMSDKYPSMSPYMYCAGNPVILVDPNGMELTDFQLKKNGQIVQIGKANSEPDRLFNQDKSDHITVNDKKILPQLVQNQNKFQKETFDGIADGVGYKNKATTKNAKDAANILDFMSRNSDSEWAVYASKDKNFHLGTDGWGNNAPSAEDLGLNSSDAKTMIHCHTKGSEKDEVGNLWGDKRVAPSKSYNYYTYYGVTKNLYKINKNGTHNKPQKSSLNQIIEILKR